MLMGPTSLDNELGLPRFRTRDLYRLGLIDPVASTGARLFFDPEDVKRVESWPDLTGIRHPGATRVRIQPTTWNRNLDLMGNADAVRQWWPVRNPDESEFLVVTSLNFVVAVYKITGWYPEFGRVAFTVEPPGPNGSVFEGRRLTSPTGPIAEPIYPSNG